MRAKPPRIIVYDGTIPPAMEVVMGPGNPRPR